MKEKEKEPSRTAASSAGIFTVIHNFKNETRFSLFIL